MPWKIRREVYLIVLGAFIIAASIIVWALHESVSVSLLAAIGFAGGLAIILNVLPGGDDRKP